MSHLPEIFRDDEFLRDFLGTYEDLLGTLNSRIDQLHWELDPATASADFLVWLSRWVGLELDLTLPMRGQRNLVKSALVGAGERGTERGMVASLAAALCVDPKRVSVRPGDAEEGKPRYSFQVEIDISSQQPNTVTNHKDVDKKHEAIAIKNLERQVFLIIDAVKPANIACDKLKISSNGEVVFIWPKT